MNDTTVSRRPTATLFAQVLALVLLSLTLAQAVNIWVIFHLPRPSPAYYTASEIAQALQKGATPASREPIDDRTLLVRPAEPPKRAPDQPRWFIRQRTEIAAALGVTSDDIVVSIYNDADRRAIREVRDRLERSGQSREAPFLIAPFQVWAKRADGQWLTLSSPPPPFPSPWHIRIMVWLLITAVAMAPVAWLFARRLSSSVALFAEAAERLGRDPNAPPLQVKGPSEIGPAIAAFNEMQDRLRRYVVDRTAMAAAMAHDLRTPLTRLRFRVESAPPELRRKMAADMDEMEAMISASLAYVRDARGAAEHTPLELSSLLESIVDDMAETGAKVSVERADRVVLKGDPMGLRRLITNLIENAGKFGGSARCRVYARDGSAIVQIEDDGPGVPENDLEKVFEPFYRGEPSRNRKTGGSGLGLAAVRSIARAHGGDAVLRNRPADIDRGVSAGLIAEVILPI